MGRLFENTPLLDNDNKAKWAPTASDLPSPEGASAASPTLAPAICVPPVLLSPWGQVPQEGDPEP